MNSNINNQNIFFQELIKNQRKNLILDRKLKISDLRRISSYLSTSIFEKKCTIWNGYITEFKNKSYYINFYFNGKKHALHRLLYYNFIDDIADNEYLKYKCTDKGMCCCIFHFTKINHVEKQDNLLEKFDNSNNTIENTIENIIEHHISPTLKYKKKIFVDL